MTVATVQHFRYDFLTAGGFLPGQRRQVTFAEGPFFRFKASVLTAQPFEASNQDRTLQVTDIRARTTGLGQELNLIVENVGVDTVIIWYVLLGVIAA
jgi:hypothetical protein